MGPFDCIAIITPHPLPCPLPLPLLSLLIALFSTPAWALSPPSTTPAASTLSSLLLSSSSFSTLASAASTLTLCLAALLYLGLHSFYHGSRRKQHARNDSKASTIILPQQFVSLDHLGQRLFAPGSGPRISNNSTSSENRSKSNSSSTPLFQFSSTITSTTTSLPLSQSSAEPSSTTAGERHDNVQQKQQQQQPRSAYATSPTTPSILLPSLSSAHQQEQQQPQSQERQEQQDHLDVIDSSDVDSGSPQRNSSKRSKHIGTAGNTGNSSATKLDLLTPVATPRSSARCSVFEVVPKEILDAIRTHPDYRIWDLVIVGEGSETLQSACRLAYQYPTKTVLVVLEDDIRPSLKQRLVQWIQTTLAAQAQRLWTTEALRAVSASVRSNGTSSFTSSSTLPPGSTLLREPIEVMLDKTRPMELSSLPPNLCIGSGLCATKILIDKPINALLAVDSTTATTTTTQATTHSSTAQSSIPRPVRRFNSIGGDQRNNLTINTTTLAPARTVGLEIMSVKDAKDALCQLFCTDSIVFASDKHPLVHSLDAYTTPPTSRDAGGRRSSCATAESRPHWPRMVFSISIQHLRAKEQHTKQRREYQHQRQHLHWASPSTLYHLLTSASFIVGRISGNIATEEEGASRKQEVTIETRPVLLHQSDRVVQYGAVRARQPEDLDTSEDMLRLEISASTPSLDESAPIQVQVKVVTQPVAQDAFGNTEMIRKGEAVLMEGLVLARQMAHTAGWTCLGEDDSHMVEWVRDQMSIQWWSENGSSYPTTKLSTVCADLEGLKLFARSPTPSIGNTTRVRTPNLSPYASRTHSYRQKKTSRDLLEMGDRRDSTLERLQEVSGNLQAHENEKMEKIEREDEDHLRVSKVTIAAVESPSSQRPGLKTSFGGFSSLSDTRIQTLALAEETEDHLGMALSIAPLGGLTSPKERPSTSPEQSAGGGSHGSSGAGSFSEGVGPLDLLGSDSTKPVSPKPRMLSRFSIKSYQLERSNHGLSDEWAIGGGGLDTTLGVAVATAASPTATNDLLSTPPLVADGGLSGTVSPLTPTPENLLVTDYMQSLDVSIGGGGGSTPRKSFDRTGSSNLYDRDGGDGSFGSEEPLVQDNIYINNAIDSGARRSVLGKTFLTRTGEGGGISCVGKGLGVGQVNPSPLEAPVELVHDFLGESFGAPAMKAAFVRPLSKPEGGATGDLLERVQSVPNVPTTKMVHFADSDLRQSDEKLQRVHSEPAVGCSTTSSVGSRMEGEASTSVDANNARPSLVIHSSMSSTSSSTSSLSSMSKSKAHTRRSWGQGIGGNDILGIQGLS